MRADRHVIAAITMLRTLADRATYVLFRLAASAGSIRASPQCWVGTVGKERTSRNLWISIGCPLSRRLGLPWKSHLLIFLTHWIRRARRMRCGTSVANG